LAIDLEVRAAASYRLTPWILTIEQDPTDSAPLSYLSHSHLYKQAAGVDEPYHLTSFSIELWRRSHLYYNWCSSWVGATATASVVITAWAVRSCCWRTVIASNY